MKHAVVGANFSSHSGFQVSYVKVSAPASSTLVVVHDRHAAAQLDALVSRLARDEAGRTTVITTDPLLSMRLARLGFKAYQTLDGLDRARVLDEDTMALEGVWLAYGTDDRDGSVIGGRRYGSLMEYTLIPKFVAVVRDLCGLERHLAKSSFTRLVLVGHGDLVDTAAILARSRGLTVSHVHRGPWHALRAALARMRAGAFTRWVNTDLRALVLEPVVLALLMARGLLARRPAPPRHTAPATLFVTGDRFTREIVERLRDRGEEIVVAGGTLPGRRLFRDVRGAIELERFGRLTDVFTGLRVWLDAIRQVRRVAGDRPQRDALMAKGVPYWPLVRRTVLLHLVIWPPLLNHLSMLVERAAAGRRNARLLVSHDVTAYTRTLIDAAEAHAVASFGVQHGILGEPNGHSIVRVGTLATWGPYSERWYRQHAPQRARFVVTGNPKFDPLAERIRDRSARERAVGQPFTIVICTGFVSQYSVCASDYENLLMLQTVQDWAAAHTNVRVIHKLHPGEEPAYYRSVANTLGWNESAVTKVKDAPLYDVLETADVLVAGYSTTVLEAVAVGTAAIVIDAIAGRRHIPLDAPPDVVIATSAEEIERELDRLCTRGQNPPKGGHHEDSLSSSDSAARGAFLDDQLNHLDGRATERVCDLLSRG